MWISFSVYNGYVSYMTKKYIGGKIMKKIISLMLVLMLTACVFVGCGDSAASTESSASETAVDSQATATDSADATVMDELKQIKELETKNIELVKVYNEVAALAVENGWEADEVTLKELNASDAIIKTFNDIIKEPSTANGADLAEMLSAADELITELDTNTRQRVSEPFAS